MNFFSIPNDVWIEIFSHINNPCTLASLSRTCERFRTLARGPLLRKIQWLKPRSTRRNIDFWEFNPAYVQIRNAPRTMTVGIPFKFDGMMYWTGTITPEKQFHDRIWENLPLFTSLCTLKASLRNTSISFFSYTILALIPSLRHLTVTKCTIISLHTSFAQHKALISMPEVDTSQLYPPSFPFSNLPLTGLEIRGLDGSDLQDHQFHPLNLIAATSLTHLSLVWKEDRAKEYDFLRHSLPSLTHLRVSMPILNNDLVNSLVAFVAHANPASPIGGPLVDLTIERHNISVELIRAGIAIPIRTVSSYVGPLLISSFGSSRIQIQTQNHNSHLTSMRMNNVPVGLGGFLHGVERLPEGLRVLEVMISPWMLDYEMFLAVRELFPDIEEVVCRYGEAEVSEDFPVSLGPDIFSKLPQLSTFKLYQDDECIDTDPPTGAGGPGQNHNSNANFNPNANVNANEKEQKTSPTSSIDHAADVKDLLFGWNRYCKQLRTVQLHKGVVWERRWEDDMWRERVVAQEIWA